MILLAGCCVKQEKLTQNLSISGEWKFRIDSLDHGITEKWFTGLFDETVKLPGSMAENGKGDEVTLKTPRTGDIIDKSYFTDKKYECRLHLRPRPETES